MNHQDPRQPPPETIRVLGITLHLDRAEGDYDGYAGMARLRVRVRREGGVEARIHPGFSMGAAMGMTVSIVGSDLPNLEANLRLYLAMSDSLRLAVERAERGV